ncbi:MAG: PGPGW domain-containing protein [Acidimicrobiales bacterium]
MTRPGSTPSDDDRGSEHPHLEELHRALGELEQAAIEAEIETGRREETIEEAKRHLAIRVARIVAGTVVLLVGLAMLALPGPGLITVAAGLALLAQDVPFARRLLQSVRSRLPEGEDGRVSPLFVGGSIFCAVVAFGASIWWAFLR